MSRPAGASRPTATAIVAVSDAFDAITSDRPYRESRSVEVALQVLDDGRGKQWDPDVVTAFTLLYAGTVLGARWEDIRHALQPFDLLIAVGGGGAIALFIWWRLGMPGRRRPA